RGGAEDVLGGAVVAFEPDDLGAREILLEAQDVVDLGAAPAVDGLVVVADAADIYLLLFVFAHGPHRRLRRLALRGGGLTGRRPVGLAAFSRRIRLRRLANLPP